MGTYKKKESPELSAAFLYTGIARPHLICKTWVYSGNLLCSLPQTCWG